MSIFFVPALLGVAGSVIQPIIIQRTIAGANAMLKRVDDEPADNPADEVEETPEQKKLAKDITTYREQADEHAEAWREVTFKIARCLWQARETFTTDGKRNDIGFHRWMVTNAIFYQPNERVALIRLGNPKYEAAVRAVITTSQNKGYRTLWAEVVEEMNKEGYNDDADYTGTNKTPRPRLKLSKANNSSVKTQKQSDALGFDLAALLSAATRLDKMTRGGERYTTEFEIDVEKLAKAVWEDFEAFNTFHHLIDFADELRCCIDELFKQKKYKKRDTEFAGMLGERLSERKKVKPSQAKPGEAEAA